MVTLIDVLVVGSLAALTSHIVSAIQLCLWGPLHHIPGPFWSNFTSLPDLYHSFAQDHSFWIYRLHQRYGPAVRIAPNSVSVTGVEGTKTIFGLGSKPYNKWSGYTRLLRLLGPNVDSIATIEESSESARRRRIVSPRFTRQSLFALSERIESCITRYGMNLELQRKKESQGIVDILHVMRMATLDVLTDIAYGGCWKGKGLELSQLLGTVAFSQLLRDIAAPLYHILFHVPLKSLNWVRVPQTTLKLSHDSIESYIQAHSSSLEKPKEPLSDILFSSDPQTGATLTRPEQDLETVILLLAGIDTTADTAALTAWEISKHPNVVAKLQEELDELFPNLSLESTPTPSTRDAEKATWMTACLKEGLRLHPSLPGPMHRVVPAGGAKLAGFTIPQDTVVSMSAYAVHRDVSIFPDPNEFKPERWLEETQEMKTTFVAFGQGPRLCLGYNLAWMELRLMLTLLFRNYNVSPAPGVKIELRDAFTLHPKSGKCPLLLERR